MSSNSSMINVSSTADRSDGDDTTTGRSRGLRRALIPLAAAAAIAIPTALTAGAQADAPAAWQDRTNTCDSLSFYSENPAYNPNATPTHAVGGYKKMWWTTGEIVNGWEPVYSAGQEDWHTGWVRQECLADGWGYPDNGYVIY